MSGWRHLNADKSGKGKGRNKLMNGEYWEFGDSWKVNRVTGMEVKGNNAGGSRRRYSKDEEIRE